MQTGQSAATVARRLSGDAEKGMVGRALAVNMPEDTHSRDARRRTQSVTALSKTKKITSTQTTKTDEIRTTYEGKPGP